MDYARSSPGVYRINPSGFHLNSSGSLPNLSGSFVIKTLLDEVDNFGTVLRDMRIVPGTTVSRSLPSTSAPIMTPHRILAAVPDPCGFPVAFRFPRVYPCAMWRPTRRTVMAQWLPAHDLLSLFKGGGGSTSSSSRIRTPRAACALRPLHSSRRRSPPRSAVSPRPYEEVPRGLAPQRFTEAPPPIPSRAPPRHHFLFFASVRHRSISGDQHPRILRLSQRSGSTGRLEAEIDRMNLSSSAPEAGTGKGQEAGSSSQATGANLTAVTRGAWKGSDVKEPEIDWLYRSRRIPAEVACRLPRGEVEPAPEAGEYVVFSAHFERGFGLPASNFFREFLDFYQLQPHHLPGNAIFYLSCFVSFMEAYVGLLPSKEAFARFFGLRINSVQGKNIPNPKPPTFFYVKNKGAADFINLPAYQPGTPSKTNWTYNPATNHIETNRIVRFLEKLKRDTGICSDDIIRAFISRRVLPLQRRAHKMSQMRGRRDPTKITSFALSKEDVVLKAKQICQTEMPMDWEWGLLPLSAMNPPTAETCERFPRITAEALQGPIRKRALDEEDPDPLAAGHKHKMGRTHTSRPDLPSASADPPIVEHATPLEAMVGQEFLDKLATRGQKKKAPAPEAGTSEAPPPKRSRTETVAGKVVTSKRYRKREMPVSSGPPLKIAKSATGMRPESTEGARQPHLLTPSPAPPGAGTSASHGEATQTHRKLPHLHRLLLPAHQPPAGLQLHRKTLPRWPAPPALLLRLASLVLHAPRAHMAEKRPQLRWAGSPSSPAAEPTHLADYAEKWNRASVPIDGSGKDYRWLILPGPGAPNTFDTRKRLFEELLWEHRELSEAHSKCQAVPEATVKDLTDQLATLKAEKEQLAKEHQEALDAQRKVTAELKDKLMESEVRHSQELKDAKAAAELKLDDTLKEFTNSSAVLRTELEEESKARKAAEERIAALTTDQAAYDQLVVQADALAFKLFPDSQVHASKKVAEYRAKQPTTNPDAPWDSYEHLVALAARICHMRAVDRHLVELPERAIEIFKVLWPEEAVPVNLTLISDRLKDACRRFREWKCSAARAGADAALRIACSWYEDLDLDAFHSIRGDAPTDTDPVLSAKRQDRAYRIAEFAQTHTFIPPPSGVRDEISDDEEDAEDEEDEETAEGSAPPEQGDAPPEASKAGTQPPVA
ncbi:hypothetical protein QYE76_036715 [Lolium multiflorum]|uniref:Transposase (putative) gypsy type domain-containing protein n=1 Tax=Lolium multiflorum TaxID=4521 RepID=A0AAD8R2H4_LOLMU|nr:hypothetical protein QYE76_036715 [Lolium multiflorum]